MNVVIIMATNNLELRKQLQNTIMEYPDFPSKNVIFREISPIFLNPTLCNAIIDDLANFSKGKVDAICGIESRGYFFGISLALKLNVPFLTVRKAGKLPPPVVSETYTLEYGTASIEMKPFSSKKKLRVLVHDDLLATGGTTCAAVSLLAKQNLTVTQFSFLINLMQLKGIDKIRSVSSAEIYSILDY